ncbi:Oidioi.mRNA.OKI2018_I69.PAR.g8588.t1.cds [Oikopleura dioica]|uniref:Oidioi.mRNA.OKI2018_I69.PAR.g8588.t1.cds n=1 Tax=Oikopleura dioica TaxID=34765 RepID=A0ABN7RJZ8_OIKDI|nr:Oidioi.mRNA.OKI2018_I69.PAR.g8588.t1.cds [Oikopleura dioica]
MIPDFSEEKSPKSGEEMSRLRSGGTTILTASTVQYGRPPQKRPVYRSEFVIRLRKVQKSALEFCIAEDRHEFFFQKVPRAKFTARKVSFIEF